MTSRHATTVRLPEELAEAAEVVARGKGISVNALIVESLEVEIDRVRSDDTFMSVLHGMVERDAGILDRLAQ